MNAGGMIKHQRKTCYRELSEASSKGIKVAYCCAWGPTEPLYAMDIIPAFPENYAVVVSAKRQYAKEYNVPIFYFDGPHLIRGTHTDHEPRWAIKQNGDLFRFLLQQPFLDERFRTMGLRTLEVEDGTAPQPLRTRVAAFLELLSM